VGTLVGRLGRIKLAGGILYEGKKRYNSITKYSEREDNFGLQFFHERESRVGWHRRRPRGQTGEGAKQGRGDNKKRKPEWLLLGRRNLEHLPRSEGVTRIEEGEGGRGKL